MLSIQLILLKVLFTLPLFAFYLAGIYTLLTAARQSDAKVRLLSRIAGCTLIAANILWDIVELTKPLPHHLTESLTRLCMLSAGVSLGLLIAVAILRRNP